MLIRPDYSHRAQAASIPSTTTPPASGFPAAPPGEAAGDEPVEEGEAAPDADPEAEEDDPVPLALGGPVYAVVRMPCPKVH